MNGRAWSKDEFWELQDLAQEVSQAEAARLLGRTVSSVASKVYAEGIRWRGRRVSIPQIAAELGCASQTVANAANALQLPQIGEGTGTRFLLDPLVAERLREHMRKKLARHEAHRVAGRRRGKDRSCPTK